MALSKSQRTALEKIRRARLHSRPRTSEEAYRQIQRMVAAQKKDGTAVPKFVRCSRFCVSDAKEDPGRHAIA
jgi:hypothetical protein